MNSYVTNHGCITAYSHSRPFSSRKSFYRRKHLRSLSRRISKIERQLRLNCEETTAQQSRLSLKQLQRRVERIEQHLRKEKQQAKLVLSHKHCLKFLLPEAKHWQIIGTLLEIPETTLDQIEGDHRDSVRNCIREVIKSWLKQVDPPPSWKSLAEAVHEVNPRLAKEIIDRAVNTDPGE